ncbi:MAG: ribonuclease Y [Patescibacteria group bacterium]
MDSNLLILAGSVLGIGAGYVLRIWLSKKLANSLEQKVRLELELARTKAKEVVTEAESKAVAILSESQKEEKQRKDDLRRLEDRLLKKEDAFEKDRSNLETEKDRLRKESEALESFKAETAQTREKANQELEKIAGFSREEAKSKIIKEAEDSNREELSVTLAKLEKERHDKIEARSIEIITSSLQRYSRDRIADVTTSVVSLPNEEIKGKIIGREGRNIRTFERLTGVEVIIDETPESLLLSSFDPLRRELAKMALEKLLKDGRIQPAKIEEKVEEARTELEDRIHKIGEEAAYEIGILDLPKEIFYLIGRLNYRTSYGQNVLIHSLEMAHIAGMIAAELHLNVAVAKRGALLHDIGKAIDHEVEGTHIELGRKLLKKYGIDEAIIKAMESHHDDYPFSTPESYVVAAADVISAARPGARRDTLEKYLKRMEDVEKVVNSFEGVKQSYAISAGREVRVFVVPEKIDDFGALRLAKEISGKIQANVQYPGEIKVVVIREVKAIEYAR